MNRATLLERLSTAYSHAQEAGVEVGPASHHEWDEPWQGDSGDEKVKVDAEDEEMWEDE
jgi:hypothetical protein